MTDWLTREQRSRNMAAIRSKSNKTTELLLVRLFRAAGVSGWRRHRDLPGRPDFVFVASRLAVFVDGCFWHGCPTCYVAPADNANYWHLKVMRNRRRDRRVARQLRARGWSVIRVWEHTLKVDRTQRASLRRIAARVRDGATAARHPRSR